EPGQHASVIAPTGEGKSWILRHLLELWTADKVLVVDNKGDDELWRRGDFLTVHSFPTGGSSRSSAGGVASGITWSPPTPCSRAAGRRRARWSPRPCARPIARATG